MVKIDWFLFFRQHVILGFYLKRKNTMDDVEPGPWRFHWRGNWNKTVAVKTKRMPWHLCWRWTYEEK